MYYMQYRTNIWEWLAVGKINRREGELNYQKFFDKQFTFILLVVDYILICFLFLNFCV